MAHLMIATPTGSLDELKTIAGVSSTFVYSKRIVKRDASEKAA